MVASFREICSNCMGLTGKISLVNDFYGYSSVPAPYLVPSSSYIVPGTLSLLAASETGKTSGACSSSY